MVREIQLRHVYKSYGRDQVLRDVNLTIPSGKIFVLLGPSGSGKTTILRLIAGFDAVDAGAIYLGSEEITHMPINRRSINTVFQQYALFPHMNLFHNVAYGLKIKGMKSDAIKEKVSTVLATMGLEDHMYKSVDQLSGGQKQRVALARAIVKEPEVLLLDEPLAALDFSLREKMLLELSELQNRLKTTFIYVTHSQSEALALADWMAIINDKGEVEQIGSAQDIYEFPKTSFVATFVGRTNLFQGTINKAARTFTVAGIGTFAITIPEQFFVANNGLFFMSIRPEKLNIGMKKPDHQANCIKGVVVAIMYRGRSTQYNVAIAGAMIVQIFKQNHSHRSDQNINQNNTVFIWWHKENVVLLKR